MKRLRIIFCSLSLCISIALVGFGVYAATSVSTNVTGYIKYEVDTSVTIQTRVVKSPTHLNNDQITSLVDELSSIGLNDSVESLGLSDYDTSDPFTTPEDKSSTYIYDLELKFKAKQNPVFTYFIIVNIKNTVDENNVWAILDDSAVDYMDLSFDTESNELQSKEIANTFQHSNGVQEEIGTAGKNIVIAMGIENYYKPVSFKEFDYQINIGAGSVGDEDFNLEKLTVTNNTVTAVSTDIKGVVVIPDNVTEISENAFKNCSLITKVIIPNSVTSIGNNAFSGCNLLSQLEIGSGLQTIGTSAFENCPSLYSIKISPENQTFTDGTLQSQQQSAQLASYNFASQFDQSSAGKNCIIEISTKKLIFGCKTSVLPSDVAEIGANAFKGCNIKQITIPASVTTIGNSAFYNCRNLEQINYNAVQLNDLSDSNNGFALCGVDSDGVKVIIDNSVTKIPAYLFCPSSSDATLSPNITSLTIGSNVQTLGNYSFYNNKNLKEINFNATSMTDLNSDNMVFDYAGTQSDGITFNVGANVQKIPAYLFGKAWTDYENDNFVEVNVTKVNFEANGVCSTVGDYAFRGCANLQNITIDPTCTYLTDGRQSDASPSQNCIINKNSQTLLVGSTSSEIPQSSTIVVSIANYAFMNKNIEEIIIPNNITTIGTHAFSYCTSKNLEVGTGVKTLGNYCFVFCFNLENIYYDAISTNDLQATSHIFAHSGKKDNYKTYTKFVFGNNVTKIPSNMFFNAVQDNTNVVALGVNISEITIGNNVINIGYCAFTGLALVEKVYYNATNANNLIANNYVFTGVGYSVEKLSVIIGDNVTYIPQYLFSPCEDSPTGLFQSPLGLGGYAYIKNLTIGKNVTSIGNYAFAHCKLLKQLNFNAKDMPDLVQKNYVFYDVGYEAEDGMTVHFGKEVQNIPKYIFLTLTSSVSINDQYQVPKITHISFDYNCVISAYNIHTLETYSYLKSVVVPESFTSIPSNKMFTTSTITDVYYTNSKEMWENVTNKTNLPASATVSFMYGWELVETITEVSCTQEGLGVYERDGQQTQLTIPKLPHNYVNNVCTICGQTKKYNIQEISGSYGFVNDGTGKYVSNNQGQKSTTATATLTALADCTITINWTVDSYSSDKLTIKVGSTSYCNTGGQAKSGTVTLNLTQGQVVTFAFKKGSFTLGSTYSDTATFIISDD